MRRVVEEYGINHVLHFTQADNLASIFTHGLVPVDEHFQKGITADKNDKERNDLCPGATCLSLTCTNYKVFWTFRFKDLQKDWAVLFLLPQVLYEKECAFCVTNAASSSVTSIPLRARMGERAFREMFAEDPLKPSRKQLGLTPVFPTNPQAEVLAFGLIQPHYIWGVGFDDPIAHIKYKGVIPSQVKTDIVPWAFKNRFDHLYWR